MNTEIIKKKKPPLYEDKELTMDLINRAQSGDREAMDILARDNVGLIWSIVRKFAGRGYDLEDLFQIGAIGLLKCVDKFDESYGVRFSTYAVPMIMGEIKRFLRDDGMIKVSRTIKEISTKAKYTQEVLQRQNGRSPTMDELAAALDTDVAELAFALESNFEVESLYKTTDKGDGSPVYLIDKLDPFEGSDDLMVDKIALKQLISRLTGKERQVILLRYFKDRTQTQVAEQIGVSQVQVSRIEKKVLKRLREELSAP